MNAVSRVPFGTGEQDRAWFLRVLHPEGWRDLRALDLSAPPDKQVKNLALLPANDLAGVERWLKEHHRWHLYVGVAPRDGKGRSAEHCLPLRAVHCEIDFKETPEDEARARLAGFPLKPSIVIRSGGGLHVYWLLEQPLNPDVSAKALLRSLALELGGDMSAAEVVRILRLPGTLNHKYDPPRPVEVETLDIEHAVSVEQLRAVLPPLVVREQEPEQSAVKHTLSTQQRQHLATAWLMTQEPAMQGQHGDHRTFNVCAAVARGFDLQNPDDAYVALREWNARCQPPWSEWHLKKKIRNGLQYGDEQIGGRLQQRQQRARILTFEPASAIQMRRPVFVWDGRLPVGMVSLAVGREGTGKSLLALTLAADLTRGRLPGMHSGKPRSVVIVAGEDAWEYVIKPRLAAAGADMRRVGRVRAQTTEYRDLEISLPDDLPALRGIVTAEDVGLILLDPIISRLGKKLDTHVDAQVRQALEPLAKFSEEAAVSMLGIIHPNKSANGIPTDPLNAIMGSRAFSAVSRSTLFLQADPEDPTLVYCMHVKCNVAALAPTLEFSIRDVVAGFDEHNEEIHAPQLEWKGARDADERWQTLLTELRKREREADDTRTSAKPRDAAEEYLKVYLADGEARPTVFSHGGHAPPWMTLSKRVGRCGSSLPPLAVRPSP